MAPADTRPLVSCIMPTCNRRAFVPHAIRYFLRQDYPRRELVVVDDGDDPVADLMPDDERIRYIRMDGRATIGVKRNLACEQARGDLIAHWDDDDWMARHRLSYQVEGLRRADADVCGLRSMLYYEPATDGAWLYDYPADQHPWLAGGALLYRREFWQASPFPDVPYGEDTLFVWSRTLERAAILPDYTFYVAMLHPGNTSPKPRDSAYWSRWPGDVRRVMGDDLDRCRALFVSPGAGGAPAGGAAVSAPAAPAGIEASTSTEHTAMSDAPAYSVIMVVHDALDMVRMATLRTLRHSAGHDARLVVVDNASSDGAEEWLRLLAARGDIDLIRSETNLGHGPGLELARRQIRSPYLVTLDSDAFPLADDWLPRLRARLEGSVKVAGIRHHRDYIHPSCLMIARETVEDQGLTFLDEKDQPSQLDVAERISVEIKRRGGQIAGLERTGELRRGSAAEPVYLGSAYEGIVYHQWYTTRSFMAGGRQVDDVPPDAVARSLRDAFERYHAEARDVTVVMGVRATPDEPERLRNALACLRALNMQSLARWRYRIVVVEQDAAPRLETALAPLADRYVFAFNPGHYNRGWGLNVGACLPGSSTGVLCLIDADLLVPADFLSRGLAALRDGRRAVLPYGEVAYLEAEATERAIGDWQTTPSTAPDEYAYAGTVHSTSQGGCMWIEAGLYREIGGYDEEFRGWGYEDREFWDRLARSTPVGRLEGRLLHLDHRRPSWTAPWVESNRRRYEEPAAPPVGRTQRRIGDPHRYAGEGESTAAMHATPTPVTPDQQHRPPGITARPGEGHLDATTARDWQNWHRWSLDRIEEIVHDEQHRPPQASTRRRLAGELAVLGGRVLDIGCGPGALWVHLETFRPFVSWAGIDVTREMISTAHRLFPGVPVARADAGSLPFGDDSFDIVLVRHVLEHLPEPLKDLTLAEAMRVARRAVVVDFYVPPIATGPHVSARVGENFLETQWAVADLEAPIVAAGWQVRERFTLSEGGLEADAVWIITPDEGDDGREHGCEAARRSDSKVSIIMPTFHRAHTIGRTIATIGAQTYENWELIVVDNAGNGGYQFDDPRIRVYQHPERIGASYARNQGLQYATGDLVCFFDDDDDMFPNYLEQLVAAFRANHRAKLVRCGAVVSGEQVNFSYATPECCLRRPFVTPTWDDSGPEQDQRYFGRIVALNGWSEDQGDIVVVREALCRANADSAGGLREGQF